MAEDRFQQLHLLGNLNLNLGESAGLSLGTRVASWESDDYPEASGGPLLGSGEVRQSEHEEMSLRADLRLGEPARRRHKLSASLYRHDLDRQSPGVGFLVPPSIEKTATCEPVRNGQRDCSRPASLHLNAGVDLDHESARNESVFQLPVFLGGDYGLEPHHAGCVRGAHRGARPSGPGRRCAIRFSRDRRC